MHQDFSDALSQARAYSNKFYDDIGKAGMTGNLRRLKAREPMVGRDGLPMLDPRTGEVMYREEYEAANFSAAAYIFTRKNLHNWRDKVEHSEAAPKKGTAVGKALEKIMTDPRLAAAAQEIAEAMVEDGE